MDVNAYSLAIEKGTDIKTIIVKKFSTTNTLYPALRYSNTYVRMYLNTIKHFHSHSNEEDINYNC